jgi:DNA-binding response OmpR family regulator
MALTHVQFGSNCLAASATSHLLTSQRRYNVHVRLRQSGGIATGTVINVPTKILITEDEHELRQILKETMEKAGYEVVTANNGREALESVRIESPDVVLMDVMMPEMNGFEAMRLIKEDPATAHIPVVMLTGLEDDSNISKGWRMGTSLYLKKPFVPGQLISYIKLILDRD